MAGGVAQRGVALLTALLIVSLVTIVAVDLVVRQHFDIRRTANILETDQGYLYALGVESALTKLVQTYEQNKKYTDPKDLEMLNASSPFPVEGGVVAFHVDDMEGLFNINNIVNDNGVKDEKQFTLLIKIFGKVGMPLEVAGAALDWIDKDSDVTFPGGAEDGEYLGMQPAYRPPNRRMASASELLLVKGFKDKDPDLMKQRMEIFHWVTALPESGTKLNINSVSADVLTVILDTYAPAAVANVQTFLTDRKAKPVQDVTDKAAFQQLSLFNSLNANDVTTAANKLVEAQLFDIKTNYFMVSANSAVGQSNTQLSSLIMCAANCASTVVIARSQGTPGMF